MGPAAAPDPARPLRRDAERNRRRILAAATEVFADRGLQASLDEIADYAGVGIGTVYRRFPDKDALIEELFEERIRGIAQLGAQALAADDPLEAFLSFLTEAIRRQAEDRGLKQAFVFRGRDRSESARRTVQPVVEELLKRAQRAGEIRADLGLQDISLFSLMISGVADLTRDVAPETWRRMLQFIFDGILERRAHPTPLPVAAPTHHDLLDAIRFRGFP